MLGTDRGWVRRCYWRMAIAGICAGAGLGLFVTGFASSEPDHVIREGTELVDQLGTFTPAGDRLVFMLSDGKRRLVGLENLNLERISRAMADNPDSVTWMVSGTVTEYRGANYLVVRRATLKSRPSPVGLSPPSVGPAVR